MQAFACDLDRTLIGHGGLLGSRTRAAITRSQKAGIPVIVATGRMFRSVRPYLEDAGIAEPVICYQGAAVVDPTSGTFLLHEPIPLEVAREAIATLVEAGHPPNVYVDDRLFVERHTEFSQMYADFQRLPVEEVGDLVAWLERPPTKLVAVLPAGRPGRRAVAAGQAVRATALSDDVVAVPARARKPQGVEGHGLAFVADRLGLEAASVVRSATARTTSS